MTRGVSCHSSVVPRLSCASSPLPLVSLVSCLLCVFSVGSYSLAVFANIACCHCCCCCGCRRFCWCWRCCCCQQLLATSDTWHLMCIIAQLTISCHFRGADSARDEAEAVAGEVRFLCWNFEVKVLHDHKRNQITNRAQMPLQVLRQERGAGECWVVDARLSQCVRHFYEQLQKIFPLASSTAAALCFAQYCCAWTVLCVCVGVDLFDVKVDVAADVADSRRNTYTKLRSSNLIWVQVSLCTCFPGYLLKLRTLKCNWLTRSTLRLWHSKGKTAVPNLLPAAQREGERWGRGRRGGSAGRRTGEGASIKNLKNFAVRAILHYGQCFGSPTFN